jgi:hypothetical protein
MQSYFSVIAIVTFLHFAAASGLGPDGSEVSRPTCAAGEHIHKCADLRIAAIRVERVNDCGFEFADLEDNTVGLPNGNGHHWDYSEKFEVARFTGNQVEWLGRRAVKPGMLGVAIYCSSQGCGRVLLLQLLKPESFSAKVP